MKQSITQLIPILDPRRGLDANLRTDLEQAIKDAPHLADKMKAEQTFDAIFASRLNCVEPPPALAARLHQLKKTALLTNAAPIPFPIVRHSGNLMMSLAASIILMFALFVSLAYSPVKAEPTPRLEQFMQSVGKFTTNVSGITKVADTADFPTLLKNMQSPVPADLPEQLNRLRGIGCRTIEFDGIRASMMCFKGEAVYHLFVVERSAFPFQRDRSIKSPFKSSCAGMHLSSWTDERYLYILSSLACVPCVEDVR
jgi:hypothetical protein